MTPKKQFEYKGGIATRINNPEGYNKHKKNPNPSKKEESYKDLVMYMDESEAINEYKKLFQKRMKLKREALSLSHKLVTLHNYIFNIKE